MITLTALVDTNMLLRSAQPTHPQFPQAIAAISKLKLRGFALFIFPQNLYEFWVVATRPMAQNGLGMSPAQAKLELDRLKTLFMLLNDPAALFSEWERVVDLHSVSGKEAHDARLVAAMVLHGVPHILTANVRDFARYAIDGIIVLDPALV